MAEYISLVQQELLAQTDRPTKVAWTAERLYVRARRGRRLAALWGRLVGRPAYLRDLTAIPDPVVGQHELAAQTVPLAQIRGSEGRTRDFDSAFRPLEEHSRERWISVARARLEDTPLPAVELIRAGDTYYVRDGHHRISVARALGQRDIDARVTVWDTVPAGAAEPGTLGVTCPA
jgi:hypothetical protein